MTIIFNNLRVCSYNVHGLNNTKYCYISKLLDSHDIVLIQEHWLYESQFHIFDDTFPGISSYCVSSMDDKIVKSGRGYGGCAILWKSTMSCTVEPCNLENNRVCAIKVKLDNICLLVCSVYMPCDTLYD